MTTDSIPTEIVPTITDLTMAEIYACDMQDEADAAMKRLGDGFDVAEWVVGKLVELDAAEENIEERAKAHKTALLAEVKARRAGLLWKFGTAVRQEVDAKLVGKKTKSVSFATGRAGYRTSAGKRTLVIDDEAKAIDYAAVHHPEAIRDSIDRKMLEDFHKEWKTPPPGSHWETTPAGESFYIGPVTVTRPQLTAEPVETETDAAALGGRQRANDFLNGTVPFED